MKSINLSVTLKKLMEERRVSSAVLSKECNIPKSTLSTYLSGGKKASYSPDHLLALSNFFSVTTDFLLFGTESDFSFLNTLPTEGVFEGWLKVKIERAVPSRISKKGKE